ncbi:MMPL family protein [Pirellula sp. SH-Sr6A]|uniref:efflux RND transporter permease subunit n=1 Tax=Pirellula sp. SH-Sr6A TaxID=1632865 RepID=UPI00078BABFA|nr:MMPL family transporter [Pirellula sp. SH-Sr6A]AMV34665.1 MMPL family protein [Pirellula sp. SH-Sr6A]
MIQFRWLGLCIAAIAFMVALPASSQLRLDRSLEKMFPDDAPTRIAFESLEQIFGVSELIVFAYRDPDLWAEDRSGLERLQRIRKRIESIPGIDSALDLSKLDGMLSSLQPSPSGFLGALGGAKTSKRPLLDEENEIAKDLKKLFEGQTHAADSDLVAVACILKENSLPEGYRDVLAELRSVDLESSQRPLLVGQRVMLEEGFDAIEEDGRRLSFYVGGALVVLLTVGIRSLRWALITIVVVQWSLVVTRALLVLFDWELTMVSSMLASIVTVIAVATAMHWMLAYQRLCRLGASPEEALQSSFYSLRGPIAWACITDAIGFASLTFSNVGPVQDYGWMMALASLVVLAGIVLCIPGLALIPLLPDRLQERVYLSPAMQGLPWLEEDWLKPVLLQVQSWVCRFPHFLMIGSSVITVLALIGSLRIQVETDFIKNFRRDAPIAIAYRAVENELGGAGVWDVIVPIPKPAREEDLQAIRELERELRSIAIESEDGPLRLTSAMSLVDADDIVSRNAWLSPIGFEGRLIGMRPAMGSFFDSLLAESSGEMDGANRFLRIMLRAREQTDAMGKEKLIEAVRSAIDTFPSRTGVQPFVSGYYVLLAELVRSVVSDQWICFAIASVGIWLAIALAMRSLVYATVALIPNAIPSLCILGWFGWTGTQVNLGAAMIAAVSMGLSVDSSIHYLTRFHRERKKLESFDEALQAAQSEIGLSVFFSTFALMMGFGALAMSDFLPTVVFGTTAACTMLGGMIGNLVLLPALLQSVRKIL